MNLYFVSYDLRTPGRDYSELYAKLESLGAKRILESEWALKGTYSVTDLRDELKKYLDSNDRLMVAKVTGWASFNTINTPKDL